MKNNKKKHCILFKKGVNIHMAGVSGIGMSALASFLVNIGCKVSGSDYKKTIDVPEAVDFKGEQVARNIKKNLDCLIISQAIPYDNPEVKKAIDLGVEIFTYPEAIACLTNDYNLICVAGTHGKSTTTSMLAKILIDAGMDINVIVGTRVEALDGKNFRIGESNLFLLEACEYNEAFLNYSPNLLVITNVEPDHLDYYKTEENYINAFKKLVNNVEPNGLILLRGDDELSMSVIDGFQGEFRSVSMKDFSTLDLSVIGMYNQENARMAVEAAKYLEVDVRKAEESISTFTGSWRRLEYKGRFLGADVYDDYAHHPTEIIATLKALKIAYPTKKIVCVFQPHQYSRTIELFDGFVEALQEAYYVIIPNIYKVRDTQKDIDSISVDDLVDEINNYEDIERAVNGEGFENTVELLKRILDKNHLCVVMGAGDIEGFFNLIDLELPE